MISSSKHLLSRFADGFGRAALSAAVVAVSVAAGAANARADHAPKAPAPNSSPLGIDESGMFPFLPSYDKAQGVVDMSHLVEAPVGAHGRIRAEGGHFVNDRGRVRLNATNLTGPANFPTHEEAERLASRLAGFGINCVRLHYFDDEYGCLKDEYAFVGTGAAAAAIAKLKELCGET